MLIRFSKSRHGPVLVCTRGDGSVTGMKSEKHGGFFARHDLMHYAVETTLGLREAFYGLLASGWSIETFNEPGNSKRLPGDAILAEFIVGIIDQAAIFSDKPLDADDINRDVRSAIAQGAGALPEPAISQETLNQIMQRFMSLYAQFQSLPVGGHLELPFPPGTGAAVKVCDHAGESAGGGWPNAPARRW